MQLNTVIEAPLLEETIEQEEPPLFSPIDAGVGVFPISQQNSNNIILVEDTIPQSVDSGPLFPPIDSEEGAFSNSQQSSKNKNKTVTINFQTNAKQPSFAPLNELPEFTIQEPFFNFSDTSENLNLSQYPSAIDKKIRALNGNDFVEGTGGFDDINGNRGNDVLLGGLGNDYLRGGKDFDSVLGEDGNDTVNGNNDNDTVSGGLGNDILRGGRDNDILLGESGNDFLVGDFGQDSLIGGLGSDIFVLRSDKNKAEQLSNTSTEVSQVDIISDFNPNESDKIALTDELSYTNLTFESIKVTINGATSPATAIKIETNSEYLGIVINLNISAVKNASNFIVADSRLEVG